MGMLKRIKAGWTAMTTAEKVKMILRLICAGGTGCVCGDIAAQHMPGKSKLEQFEIFVAGVGVGGYLGNKAGEYLGDAVDAVMELNEIRKECKAEKEANANG